VAKGTSLLDVLRAGPAPWSWSRALEIIWRVAWAIVPAHQAGFVHRDLHPGNIFIDDASFDYDRHTAEGSPGVSILDLGVRANTWDAYLEPDETAHTFRPVGSVRYASPEALNDPSSATQRSDIWSIGVLFFHLLTGSFPFAERTLRALMDASTS